MYSHLTRRVPCEHIRARARPWEHGFLKMRWFSPGNVLDIITVAMVGRLGWYDCQYPVALSACLSGKGVRSEVTLSRSRRELSNGRLERRSSESMATLCAEARQRPGEGDGRRVDCRGTAMVDAFPTALLENRDAAQVRPRG